MELGEIMNIVLGGGLLASLVKLATLRSTVREANAAAEKARAEAETVRIDNAEHATRILIENIVEPLRRELDETRKELEATRKDLQATKREMARLRKAVDAANTCRHSDDCPVLMGVRELPKDGGDDGPAVVEPKRRGQRRNRDPAVLDGDSPELVGRAAAEQVFQPADSLWRLPERAEVRAESGRAVVTLRREGRNIVARADCDSLRRMCALLESRSAHYRAQRDTLQEELREERKRRGNPLRTFFTGLAAGILLTAGTLIFIKLRRKHSTN